MAPTPERDVEISNTFVWAYLLTGAVRQPK
jgi:hypothetical protein